jgi:hypothetical protein
VLLHELLQWFGLQHLAALAQACERARKLLFVNSQQNYLQCFTCIARMSCREGVAIRKIYSRCCSWSHRWFLETPELFVKQSSLSDSSPNGEASSPALQISARTTASEEQVCEYDLVALCDHVDDERNQHLQKATRSRKPSANRPRIRLVYSDESIHARFRANAQRLLVAALDDPDASATSVQIARKALGYRKLMVRLDEVDPHDPAFDVSVFFGIEWRRRDPALDRR